MEEPMAILGEITHTTTYKYAKPVTFGTHRAMFLPKRGASARLLNWSARTSPPSKTRWISDTRSNTVTVMEFSEGGSELTFTFKVLGIYFGIKGVEAFPLEKRAEEIPVQYTPDEWTDLEGYLRPHAEDPDASVAAWAKSFVAGDQDRTTDVLGRILHNFRDGFTYIAREAHGTQSPGETLRTKSGTCRDYAWLMIETLRRLGFASRFVSGYLYDAALDGGAVGMVGSSATHAWLQVFLPGAGWMDYDPTNQINAGFDLIPVAVARHPGQAIPLEGSWFGDAKDYQGMSVKVAVHKVDDVADQSEGQN
jgi:transglutaminase-like putative cysteine protease